MKTFCRILLATLIILKCLNAQYQTTFVLYDTIAEGPYIEPGNDGYHFLFKNKKEGTMVSTRGQVINPSVDYKIFNHYFLNADGTVDSLFSVPIRTEVNNHYTMYQRGAPKIIQYRVGTSNDPTLDKILSKYPIIQSERNNDENLSIDEITFEDNTYRLVNKEYSKGKYKEQKVEKAIDLEAEEGEWILKHQNIAASSFHPVTLLVYGKKIDGDKERKFNDLMEYQLIALDRKGNVLREEEIFFDKPYEFQSSGIIHNVDGSEEGFFMSMVEANVKINKEYNSAVRKLLFFDTKGFYDSETEITIPFESKGKDVDRHSVVKVVGTSGGRIINLQTAGDKKAKVTEGLFSYKVGQESSELLGFKGISEIAVEQDLRNKYEDTPSASTDFKYGLQLDNADFLSIASENGIDLQFLHYGKNGMLKKKSAGYLLTDIASQKNQLSFEYLKNNKILIISKVGYEKGVYTSYSIYDAQSGKLETIQPKEDIATIFTYRNGGDILVYGSSYEDDKKIHMVLHKLDVKEEGFTSLDQEE